MGRVDDFGEVNPDQCRLTHLCWVSSLKHSPSKLTFHLRRLWSGSGMGSCRPVGTSVTPGQRKTEPAAVVNNYVGLVPTVKLDGELNVLIWSAADVVRHIQTASRRFRLVRREWAEPKFSPGLSEENCPFKLLIDSSLRCLSGTNAVEMSYGNI